MSTPTVQLRQLTDSERLDAQDTAKAIIRRRIGEKPTYEQFAQRLPRKPERADYADHTISRYPRRVTFLVGLLMAIVFIASAMPSLFRLFSVGRDYFAEGIQNQATQSAIVGLATFLLAEFLVILSTLSARVFFKGRAQIVFIIPIVMGLLMALVGNWTVTQPSDLFGWLETIVPVGAVLFTALVGERLILDSIRASHSNEQAFKQALGTYEGRVKELRDIQQKLYDNALDQWEEQNEILERHPHWQSAYANALKDKIIESNARGRGASDRREYMNSLTGQAWKPYILRELQADKWVDDLFIDETPHQPAPTQQEAVQTANATQRLTHSSASSSAPQSAEATLTEYTTAVEGVATEDDFLAQTPSQNGSSKPS